MKIVALVRAGFWYVSETFIQMRFYRFSIFVKLLACVGAAIFLARFAPVKVRGILLGAVIVPLVIVAVVARGEGVVVFLMPGGVNGYLASGHLGEGGGDTSRGAGVFVAPPE